VRQINKLPKTSGIGFDGLLRNAATVGALALMISAADWPAGQGKQVQGEGHCEVPEPKVHRFARILCPLHERLGFAKSGIRGTIIVLETLSWIPVPASMKSFWSLAVGLRHSHLGSPRETMMVLKQGPTNVLSVAPLVRMLQWALA